jgi:hypothetical protein
MGKVVIATVAAFLLVPVFGAVFGSVLLAWYRWRVRLGKMKAEDIPFFGVLLLRGMILTFALIAIAGIAANIHAGAPKE